MDLIDKQFKERPIPNFYKLLSESVNVDVEEGMSFELEKDIHKYYERGCRSKMAYHEKLESFYYSDLAPIVHEAINSSMYYGMVVLVAKIW